MADSTREQFGTELFARAIVEDGVMGDVLLEDAAEPEEDPKKKPLEAPPVTPSEDRPA